MNTTTSPMIATVTRTAKGARIDLPYGPANVGAAFPFVILYSTGGWNAQTYRETGETVRDLPCFGKSKTEANALKAAREHVAYAGGTFEIVPVQELA